MLAQMLDSDSDRNYIPISKQDKTVLFINNLGGVSVLELGGIVSEVYCQLTKNYGIKPVRIIAGTFMTSLNGNGFSISILKLVETGLGIDMLELLDVSAEAVGWTASIRTKTWDSASERRPSQTLEGAKLEEEQRPSNIKIQYGPTRTALLSGLNRLIKAEPDVTRYDTILGDGDCGIGLKRGAEALLRMLERSKPTDDIALLLDRVIQVVETSMDGTSGALYAIFLNSLARAIRAQATSQEQHMQVGMWAKALEKSLRALKQYTPAEPGDRTLIDALNPFVGALSHTGNLKKAAAAAQEGAVKTKTMQASLGRAVYVGSKNLDVPDPGAWGLSEFLSGLVEGLG